MQCTPNPSGPPPEMLCIPDPFGIINPHAPTALHGTRGPSNADGLATVLLGCDRFALLPTGGARRARSAKR